MTLTVDELARPMTAEEAVEKALLYTFQLSGKDYRKMQTAMSEVTFIRALEQDGYTVADTAGIDAALLALAFQDCSCFTEDDAEKWALHVAAEYNARLAAALSHPQARGRAMTVTRVTMFPTTSNVTGDATVVMYLMLPPKPSRWQRFKRRIRRLVSR